jgi:hypothetical protein
MRLNKLIPRKSSICGQDIRRELQLQEIIYRVHRFDATFRLPSVSNKTLHAALYSPQQGKKIDV